MQAVRMTATPELGFNATSRCYFVKLHTGELNPQLTNFALTPVTIDLTSGEGQYVIDTATGYRAEVTIPGAAWTDPEEFTRIVNAAGPFCFMGGLRELQALRAMMFGVYKVMGKTDR